MVTVVVSVLMKLLPGGSWTNDPPLTAVAAISKHPFSKFRWRWARSLLPSHRAVNKRLDRGCCRWSFRRSSVLRVKRLRAS